MSAHTSITGGVPAAPRRSAGRGVRVVVILLACIGILWGALHVSADFTKSPSVSLADGTRFVFVPSRSAPEVTVIDGKSDRVVTRIGLAGIPGQAVVSDAAQAIAVSFAGRNVLEIVALTDPASSTQLELPGAPDSLALSPDGYLVAAADGKHGTVTIVSLQKRGLLFTLSGFGDPRNLAFSLDGSQIFVTDRDALAVVDIVQEKVVERVAFDLESGPQQPRRQQAGVAPGASALTRTADGRLGFISLANVDAVLVIDLATLKVVKRLTVGRAPSRAYGTADGRLMLVPNEGDRSVSVIDTASLEVNATLPGATDVTAINTGWLESYAFVMSRREKRVIVLDLMAFRKIAEIALPGFPGSGVVNSAGQKLYVALTDTDQTAVIDTRTHTVASLVDGAGRQPWGAFMARSNNYCH